MTLHQLLERIRTLYVEQLSAALTAAEATPEPWMRGPNGAIQAEGPFGLGARLDGLAVTEAGASVLRVDAESRVDFKAFRVAWTQGVEVRVAPFSWDSMRLSARVSPTFSPGAVVRWFLRWADADERRTPGPDRCLGAVHFMSDPVPRDGALEMQVDLGSAAIESFVGLLDALAEAGATDIEVAG